MSSIRRKFQPGGIALLCLLLLAAAGVAAPGSSAGARQATAEREEARTGDPASEACFKAMLRFPTVVEKIPGTPYWGTGMAHPGGYQQTVVVTLEANPVSAECAARFQLRGAGVGYLSYNKHHRKASDLYKLGELGYGNRGGENQVSWRNEAGTTQDDYHCGDSVWLRLRSKVVSKSSHRVIKAKTKWHEIPVLNPDGSNAAC